jgi:hypothetical protein
MSASARAADALVIGEPYAQYEDPQPDAFESDGEVRPD